jgi:hypothetical protein
MGSSITGDASFRDASASVDVPLDEILEDLEFIFMGAYRGQSDTWAVIADTQLIELQDSTDGAAATLDMTIFELAAAYRIDERFEVGIGARYLGVESGVDFTTPPPNDVAGDEDIVDPIVGFGARVPLGEKFRIHLAGDIGGGVDSDLTWQGQANLGFQAGDLISIWLGYRAIAWDVEVERRAGALGLDLVLHGPQLGVAFHF